MDATEHDGQPPREIRYPDGRIEHPAVHREPRDVRFARAIWVILGALAFGVVELWGVWRFFLDRQHREEQLNASRYPLGQQESGRLPAAPRLEQLDRLAGITAENERDRELADEQLLSSYGTTPEKEFVHIPIDRAIDLVVPTLKARKEEPAETAGKSRGLVNAGESNSGRIFQKPAQ